MSNARLELGGGNWATKDTKLLGYAVGDTSGKYIPREFDFTRNSDIAATRVNKDGLIEKHRENVLLNSDDFSIAGASDGWGKNNATVTSGYAGYDGTTNAWKFESIAETSNNNLNQNETNNAAITPLGSKVSTFSVYLKAGTTNWVRLNLNNSGNVYFDLGKGQVGTASSGNVLGQIEKAGNGFYRCSITRLSGNAFDICYIYLAESDGNLLPNTHSTPKHIFVQHPQLEYGLVATDYIETDSSTASAGVLDNLPRIDYTSGSAQLLMEPSRTNLVSLSEGIPEATGAVTKTLNYGVAPDGTTSSLKVQKNGVSGNDRIIISNDLAVSNATTYTASGFVKTIDVANTGVTTIAARVDAGTLFRQGYEWTGSSLATTSYASGGSTSNTILEDYGNGWWRIGFTFTTDGTQLDFEIDVDRRNEYDTTSIETWGWQLEEGGYATSYIPTYGASDTRAQDQAEFDQDVASGAWTIYMDLENFTILSGTFKGSFFFKSLVSPSDSALFFNQSCFGWPNTSSGLSYSCDKLGASGTEFTGKWAATYDGVNTIKIYVDGSLKSTATNVDPNRASGISSGQLQYKGDHEPRKFINDLKIYSKELSQSEAEALTA